MYLKVRYSEYIRFMKSNGSDRIGKGVKLGPHFINEVFDRKIKTEYSISDKDYHPRNKELFRIEISFITNSDTKYRIDIWSLVEMGERSNHISFSLYDNVDENGDHTDEYEAPTNKEELYEVISRISFIIKDMIKKKILTNSFCIGGTTDVRKNKMYEKILFSVGAIDIEKRETELYTERWGLYFNIDDTKYLEENLNILEGLSTLKRFTFLPFDTSHTKSNEEQKDKLKQLIRNKKIDNLLE